MERPTRRVQGRSIRTTLYGEVTRAAVWLRWVLILVGAIWFYVDPPDIVHAVWVLLGAAAYSVVLTVLLRLERHPPLAAVSVLDLLTLVSLLALRSEVGSEAFIVFGFLVLVLTLAYGWAGVALSVAAYVIGESAVSLIRPEAQLDLETVIVRAGFLIVLAVVLGALVERYEGLGERLARVSIHDRVTGLYNRHYFAEVLEQIHKLAIRGGSTYSVLVIDIGGLDTINKEQGWTAGDRLLRTIGVEARAAIRTTDVLGRVGEGAFAMALPETVLGAAEKVAKKLQDRLRPIAAGRGITIGVAAVSPTWKNGFDDGVRAAFAAVERAKPGGDSGVAVITATVAHAEDDR